MNITDNVNESNTQAATPHDETAAPLASSMFSLGHHPQDLVKLFAELAIAPDLVTKLSISVDVDECLEDCRKSIENLRGTLKLQRNQEVLAELEKFSVGYGYVSAKEMCVAIGLIASSPVQDKVTSAPESPTDSASVEKVHPNPKCKVFKFLLIGNHNNYKYGHNGNFTGQKPHWCPIDPSGKGHDQTKFYEANKDEIAEMNALVAAELAAYKPRAKETKDAGAPPKP